jgi:amidophosphoribosyltransferase
MDLGIVEAVRTAVIRLEGAFSLVIMSHDTVIGVRDAYGVRPLCLGKLGQSHWVLASETCANNTVGAVFVRDVTPGEMIVINADGWSSLNAVEMQRHALCMFETIYFARPDSEMFGQSLHAARRRMGAALYGEHPVEADLVIGVPDSGTPAALGFAEASGIPFGEGMVKNRYIQRTFIQPNQRMREMGVRMKLTPMREALEGKRVVMVDDSIVRGRPPARSCDCCWMLVLKKSMSEFQVLQSRIRVSMASTWQPGIS